MFFTMKIQSCHCMGGQHTVLEPLLPLINIFVLSSHVSIPLCVCVCVFVLQSVQETSRLLFHWLSLWLMQDVSLSVDWISTSPLFMTHWMKCCCSLFLVLWRGTKRDKCMCVCVLGVGGWRGQESTEERGRDQYIFPESPCVAGTDTGRKEGGQREEGNVFRVRKEVRKGGGKGGSRKSCLSVVSQLPYCSGIHCAGVCMDCSASTVALHSEAYTAQRFLQQTENAARERAALFPCSSTFASRFSYLPTSQSSTRAYNPDSPKHT